MIIINYFLSCSIFADYENWLIYSCKYKNMQCIKPNETKKCMKNKKD